MDSSEIASAYSKIPPEAFMPQKFHRRCLDLVRPHLRPGDAVVDLGCTYGSLTELLANDPLNLEVSACDLVPAFVESCSKRVPRASVGVANLTALPYEDNRFHAAFIIEVLEHIPDPEAAAQEIARILRPGGFCLLTMPNRDWFHFESYNERRRRFQPVDDQFYSVAEAETLLRAAGLEVQKVRGGENLYFGGGLPHLLEKLALIIFPRLHRRMKRMMILCQKPVSR